MTSPGDERRVGPYPAAKDDSPAARDLVAALPAWTRVPMSRETFLDDVTARGWHVVPMDERPDLLVIDAGWASMISTS